MHPLTIIGFLVVMVALTIVSAVAVHRASVRRLNRKYGDVVRRHKTGGAPQEVALIDKVGLVIAALVAIPATLFVIYALGK